MARYRITVNYDDGSYFSRIEEPYDDEKDWYQVGEWESPFPNEHGNSFAFGWIESAYQSDFNPVQTFGLDIIGNSVREPISLKCEKIEDQGRLA